MSRQYNVVANFIARTQGFVDGMNEVRQEAQETVNKIDQGFSGLQGTFKKVAGFIAATFAVEKIKDFAVGMIETTADMQALEGQYEQVMGGMKSTTDKYIGEMSDKWNKHPMEVKNAMMQFMAILKGKGMSEKEAFETSQKYMQMTVDGNAFANESMADSIGRTMGIIKGEYDSADSIMINFSQTLLNDIAVRDYGKKWDELTTAQQENIKTMEAIRQQTSAGVLGQAEREADSYANNLAMVKNNYAEILAQFGSPLLEVANKGLKGLSATVGALGKAFKGDWVGVKETLSGAFGAETALKIENFFILIQLKIHELKEWIQSIMPSVDNLKIIFQNLIPIFQAVGGAIAVAFQYLVSSLPTILNTITGVVAKFSEWSGFIPGIAGLVAAFATYQGILKVITIYETAYQAIQKASILLYNAQRAAVIAYGIAGGGVTGIINAMRAAMTVLNLTMLANPIVLIVALLVGLGVALVVAYQKSETFRNIVNGVWSSLKEGFGAVIDWFTTTLPQWISSLVQWFTEMKDKAVSLFSELWSNISSATQQFFAFILAALQPFINFFVNSWENLKLLVLSIVSGFFSLLTGDFEGLKLALLGIITAFKRQFENYWTLLKDTVIKVAVSLWEGIKSGFSAGKDFVINTAISLYNGVINWFKNLLINAVQTVANVNSGVRDGFTKAKDGAISIVTNLYNGVVNWIKSIPGKFTEMKNSIVSTLQGVNLYQIGVNIVQGLINGISGMIGSVWRKVNEIADGIKKKLKSALDIHSPSRVMMEIGGFVGEGLANGIEGTKSLVEKASLGLAEASNFANNFSTFSNSVSSSNGLQDRIGQSYLDGIVKESGKGDTHVTMHINIDKLTGDKQGANNFFKEINNHIRSKGGSLLT